MSTEGGGDLLMLQHWPEAAREILARHSTARQAKEGDHPRRLPQPEPVRFATTLWCQSQPLSRLDHVLFLIRFLGSVSFSVSLLVSVEQEPEQAPFSAVGGAFSPVSGPFSPVSGPFSPPLATGVPTKCHFKYRIHHV